MRSECIDKIQCVIALRGYKYSLFHKTLPKSILQMHLISVRFYELGDITRHQLYVLQGNSRKGFGSFGLSFLLIYMHYLSIKNKYVFCKIIILSSFFYILPASCVLRFVILMPHSWFSQSPVVDTLHQQLIKIRKDTQRRVFFSGKTTQSGGGVDPSESPRKTSFFTKLIKKQQKHIKIKIYEQI